MRELTYREALREALREEMKRDSSVFMIGEDIAEYGGAYKVTQGLVDEKLAQRLIRLNNLRNAVVHEQYAPTHEEVAEFADCVSATLERLLPQPIPPAPRVIGLSLAA